VLTPRFHSHRCLPCAGAQGRTWPRAGIYRYRRSQEGTFLARFFLGLRMLAPCRNKHSPDCGVRKIDLAQLARLVPADETAVIYSGQSLPYCAKSANRLCSECVTLRPIGSWKIWLPPRVAIQGGGELVVYRFGSSDTPRPRLKFVYTIEARVLSGNEATSLSTEQFDPDALAALWNDLGVTRRRWEEWGNGLTTKYVPIVEDMPQLSGLASVDEGAIRYQDDALKELLTECERALQSAHASAAQKVLESLINACSLALQKNGQVVIHPFGRDAAKAAGGPR